MRLLLTAALLTTSLLLPVTAQAQDFPSKPIRLVVPFAAGGAIINTASTTGLSSPRCARIPGAIAVSHSSARATARR